MVSFYTTEHFNFSQLSKLARDLKPSEEFNISQQTTELRLISSDVAKLQIDESKPGDSVHPQEGTGQLSGIQRFDLENDDEFEENPLGSERKGDTSDTAEQTNQIEDTARVDQANEVATSHDEPSVDEGEPERVVEEQVLEEQDEHEGELC